MSRIEQDTSLKHDTHSHATPPHTEDDDARSSYLEVAKGSPVDLAAIQARLQGSPGSDFWRSLEEAAEELKALGKDIDATTRGLNREVNQAAQGYAAWITPTNPGQPARPAQITDEANEREPVIAPPEAGLENTPAQDDPEDSNTADPS